MKAFLIAGALFLGTVSTALAQTTGGQPYGNPPTVYPPDASRAFPPDYPHSDSQQYRPSQFRGTNQPERYQDGIQGEMLRLEGTYSLVSTQNNGKMTGGANPQDRLLIRGNRFWRTVNGHTVQAGTVQVIDPFGRIKSMVLTQGEGPAMGTTYKSLYCLETNQLRITYDPRGNQPVPPSRMETSPGDGMTMTVWQRIGW